jgi:hypothetical protein
MPAPSSAILRPTGKHAVVIGGSNAGSDCSGTSSRMAGDSSVKFFEGLVLVAGGNHESISPFVQFLDAPVMEIAGLDPQILRRKVDEWRLSQGCNNRHEIGLVQPALRDPRQKAGCKHVQIDPVHHGTKPIGAGNAVMEWQQSMHYKLLSNGI